MNSKSKALLDDDLRPEYDASILRGGVRGKYLERYSAGTNLVLLDPDVAVAFPTEQAANEALRSLIRPGKVSTKPDSDPGIAHA